jgi:hypothetical protein
MIEIPVLRSAKGDAEDWLKRRSAVRIYPIGVDRATAEVNERRIKFRKMRAFS